jgi:hypothetical protein
MMLLLNNKRQFARGVPGFFTFISVAYRQQQDAGHLTDRRLAAARKTGRRGCFSGDG